MSATVDFTFTNNTPWKRNFQIANLGVPVSLVGAKLRMQFRLTPDTDEIAIMLSTENGRLILPNAALGVWGFNVSLIDAFQVPPGSYLHDLIVTLPDGTVFEAASGSATIARGITRDFLPWQN